MRTGDNHPATAAAVPPANPSRERVAAAVQFGTAAATPNNAPKALFLLAVLAFGSFCGLTFLDRLEAGHQDSPGL